MQSPKKSEIKYAREKSGLTQTEAADLVHSVTRAWQFWESGDRKMHAAFWELFNLKIKK